jgi:hypothetical protein
VLRVFRILSVLSFLSILPPTFAMDQLSDDQLDDMAKEYEAEERGTVFKPAGLRVETLALYEDGMEEFISLCHHWDKFNWDQQRILMLFFHYTRFLSDHVNNPEILQLIYIGYSHLVKALEVQLGLFNGATLDECLDAAAHVNLMILKAMK